MPRPGWTADIGELVRAHRTYTGLSQRAFAEECGIKEASLVDMETGRRDTPDGFLDTAAKVLERFDDEVAQTVHAAERMLVGNDEGTVHLDVGDSLGSEWMRAVVGRAAVTSGLIIPRLRVGATTTR